MKHLMKCILAPALAAAMGTSSCATEQPKEHIALVQRLAKASAINVENSEINVKNSEINVKNVADIVHGDTMKQCPSTSEYVRVQGKNGNCESLGYETIPDFSTCKEAFTACNDDNKKSTDFEEIDTVSYSFMWTGCQSTCYNEYAGHFCRTFNTASCEGMPGNRDMNCSSFANYVEGAYLLCRKIPPHAPCPTSSGYVRVDGKNGNCESAGKTSITDYNTCQAAFTACNDDNKESTTNHVLATVDYSFMWSGCQSTCYSPFSGHFCRTFNTASCEGMPGKADDKDCSSFANYKQGAFLLCNA